MKQKDGMLMRKVGDNAYVVVPTEGELVNTVLTLNETGAFLWNLLETDRTEEELAQALAKEYGIATEQARDDVREFVEIIREFTKATARDITNR